MWYIILGAIIFGLVATIYQITHADRLKISSLRIDLEMADLCNNEAKQKINEQNFDLGVSSETIKVLNERNEKLLDIVKTLRSRIKVYSMGITRFKNPETDIRVLQVYAREELAIALQKAGIITYKMEENWREDLKETEVKVTATINVNQIK